MAIPKTETEVYYRRLLAEQARSGKTLTEFARERGLPVHRFSWWKIEIKRRDAANERGKKRRRQKRKRASPQPQLLPVRVVEADPAPRLAPRPERDLGYEMALAGGRVLRLPPDFDPARVGALLRAMEAAC